MDIKIKILMLIHLTLLTMKTIMKSKMVKISLRRINKNFKKIKNRLFMGFLFGLFKQFWVEHLWGMECLFMRKNSVHMES